MLNRCNIILNDKLSFCELLRCNLKIQKVTLEETTQKRLLKKIENIEKMINRLRETLDSSTNLLLLEELREWNYGFTLLSNNDLFQIFINENLSLNAPVDQGLILANTNLINHNGHPSNNCSCTPQSIRYAHYFFRDRLIEHIKTERELFSPFCPREMNLYLIRSYKNFIGLSEIMRQIQNNSDNEKTRAPETDSSLSTPRSTVSQPDPSLFSSPIISTPSDENECLNSSITSFMNELNNHSFFMQKLLPQENPLSVAEFS